MLVVNVVLEILYFLISFLLSLPNPKFPHCILCETFFFHPWLLVLLASIVTPM